MSEKKDLDSNEVLSIDPDRGWSFASEEELFEFFEEDIKKVEEDFSEFKNLAIKSNPKNTLEFTLDQPEEIWKIENYFSDDRPIWLFVKTHKKRKEFIFCHCYNQEPSFIYIFFSLPLEADFSFLKERFEPVELQSFKSFKGALEGDSLSENDELSIGLYNAMMTLRSADDLMEDDFVDFADMRESAIEEADEIWRAMDSYGNHLVYFIKEFEFKNELDSEKLFYVVVTIEDTVSESNVLLFSFPTFDESLVDRYRVGENLQGDEVVQEGSH